MNRPIVILTAWLFLFGMLAFAVFYPSVFFWYNWPANFSGPESWQGFYIVDDTALVPLGWRTLFFASWLPAVVATQIFICTSIWLVVLMLRGTYFERQTVLTLQWVGASAALSGVFILIAHSCSAWILTAYNSENRFPIEPYLESGEVGVICAGLGLYLFAYVLKVTVLMDHENREMI